MNIRTVAVPRLTLGALPFWAAVALFLCGCNRGPQTSPVAGSVQYAGAPIDAGTVTFYPLAGGRPASGEIGADGTYSLSTLAPGDGALPGDYKVAIEAKRVDGGVPEPKSLQEEIAQAGAAAPRKATVQWLVPESYSSAESSGLAATVVAGSNRIDFVLP
ncbi:MAG: hypothetical protein KDA61_18315 [Planctomycetales bacterium]|nr:hypothetical protein [Planctomycetales bacterium]